MQPEYHERDRVAVSFSSICAVRSLDGVDHGAESRFRLSVRSNSNGWSMRAVGNWLSQDWPSCRPQTSTARTLGRAAADSNTIREDRERRRDDDD